MISITALSAAFAIEFGANLATWHREPGFKNLNPGVFVTTTHEASGLGLGAGGYRNSEDHISVWVGVTARTQPLPLPNDFSLRAEATAGLFSGYSRPIQPALIPGLALTRKGVTLHAGYLAKVHQDGTEAVTFALSRRF